MRKKIIGFILAACLTVPVFAQTDLGGENSFQLLLREYRLGTRNSVAAWEKYLDRYPDSRHANEVRAYIGSTYYNMGKYQEAIAELKSCDIEALAEEQRDESIMQLANAYLKEGHVQDAKIWYTMLQEISSKHQDDATYNLAYIAYNEKNYDKALKGFQQIQKTKSYHEIIPYYIGQVLLEKGDYAQAQSTAVNYLQNHAGQKDEVEMKRILGESYFGQNQYQKAIPLLEKYMLSTDNPLRKALYDLGISYFYTGANSKAASTLGAVTHVDDALTQNAYMNMGLAYLNLKERNQARMAFEQASIKNYDQNVKEQALYNYALNIHETSYSPFAESVIVFERFLNEYPNSRYADKVRDYLIEIYMNTKSYDAALNSIAKIKQPGVMILEAKQKLLFQKGTQLFANSDFNDAIHYFDQSLSLGQYNQGTKADAYYWKGESNYRLENYTQARNDFQNYLSNATDKSSDEYGLALYNIGYTQFKQKNYLNALDWFTQYVSRGAKNDKTVQADAYNRIGDCNFYNRRFETARQNYDRASDIDPSLGDYSIYQEAFVQGLQRNYQQKIQSLNRLLKNYPESQYVDDALYEQGRAFVQLEDNKNAIDRYQLLANKFPDSNLAVRAANEIGLLYYQDDKYNEAIQAYKNVISKYPGSEEARLAQRDLKSIYIDLNKVDEYAQYASTIPGGVNFDMNEHDSLTYVAAERMYMSGSTSEAKESFIRYLQTFPSGTFNLNANYYLGLIDYNQKDYSSASEHFDKVLTYPNNKFLEDAMLMNSEIAYNAKNYEKALDIYKQLKDKATTAEHRQNAMLGTLRSASMLANNEETILAASDILGDAKVSPDVANEAYYNRAKAYVSTEMVERALADWKKLSKDTRNIYGAEAKYRLAQAYFDTGNTSEAEKIVLEYIKESTPHAYWLARSFVLLSDVYMKIGKELDAKQYLLSLQQNYKENDDIQEMIKSRLKKMDNKK
ncbi:tetratricopeptide repeat protein [Phocaeicola oris]|uniref:tetratricopeptide repeat protein n=1 Tax=Phocaeicola oris TaxID=2896850 RepID=UPI00234F01D5|nr:tetratricopeptide repeat protein [Phocaeicola oris]MCE2616886.1 tetratricopeptide repeat protein [Phocaeicola oris]